MALGSPSLRTVYAPFFAMYEKKGMVVQGLFLFFTGPMLAAYITPNLMEQASIWCFFSIAQIATMLFLIRETLVLHWGRDEHKASLLAAKPQLAPPEKEAYPVAEANEEAKRSRPSRRVASPKPMAKVA